MSSHGLVGEAVRSTSREPLVTWLTAAAEHEDEADSAQPLSPISLSINSSVSITNDNNLVCLSETPAEHASVIAEAVVRAIHENSSGRCGIPMIDEDGRPRPLRVEVDASVVVDGGGNIVGNQEIIQWVLRQRSALRHQRDEEAKGDEDSRSGKRRRSDL